MKFTNLVNPVNCGMKQIKYFIFESLKDEYQPLFYIAYGKTT